MRCEREEEGLEEKEHFSQQEECFGKKKKHKWQSKEVRIASSKTFNTYQEWRSKKSFQDHLIQYSWIKNRMMCLSTHWMWILLHTRIKHESSKEKRIMESQSKSRSYHNFTLRWQSLENSHSHLFFFFLSLSVCIFHYWQSTSKHEKTDWKMKVTYINIGVHLVRWNRCFFGSHRVDGRIWGVV